MVLSHGVGGSDESVHSTFASRYVRASLPRHVPPSRPAARSRRSRAAPPIDTALLDARCSQLTRRRRVQVPDAGAVDPEGGGVPDHQRRADAGREPAAEPGVLRHHVDGARVRQAHPGLRQQELRRHGRVPRHHRAPGTPASFTSLRRPIVGTVSSLF
jgi:hypothetical protein